MTFAVLKGEMPTTDFNNLDLVAIAAQAAAAVESLMANPPYAEYEEGARETARVSLTTQFS